MVSLPTNQAVEDKGDHLSNVIYTHFHIKEGKI